MSKKKLKKKNVKNVFYTSKQSAVVRKRVLCHNYNWLNQKIYNLSKKKIKNNK